MPCFGAAACIVPDEQSDNNSCIKTGYYDFPGKILNENKSREYQVFLRSSLLYRGYARVHFALRDLLIQPFMTGFQVVSIHLDHPAIIRHQAINLTFHIRCLCIDRSRKAPGNQWTKFVN
jgi:hypothetical protein